MSNKNNLSRKNQYLTKVNYLITNSVILLLIIGIAGFFIRIYYFPYEILLSGDALEYFLYAYDMSSLGNFPSGHLIVNNGWPSFVSIFFVLSPSMSFLEYMDFQRYLSVIISVLTIIPIYLLCLRIFSQKYALLGSIFFVFNPKIVQNSFSGLTEPLFILLGITTLFLFINDSRRAVIASFGVAALFSFVRYEGMFLFFVLSVMFFIKYGKRKHVIFQYLICVCIFLLIVLPMAYIRLDTIGKDGFISHTIAGPIFINKHLIQQVPHNDDPTPENSTIIYFIIKGVFNSIWYLGIISIPFFIFLIPCSIFLILKNNEFKHVGFTKKLLILFTVVFMIPAFYLYGREFQDPRYLLILVPVLSILSVYFFKYVKINFKKPIPFFTLLLVVVLLSSVFLEYEKSDYEHQRESLAIAEDVVSIVDGSNDNGMDGSTKFFEIQKRGYASGTTEKPLKISRIVTGIKNCSECDLIIDYFDSLDEFIKESKDEGLTHIVVDGKENRPSFLNDVFYNDSKYAYLIKVYDSHDHGYNYHVKVYQINYELFNELSSP